MTFSLKRDGGGTSFLKMCLNFGSVFAWMQISETFPKPGRFVSHV